jgi:hypothetical protein
MLLPNITDNIIPLFEGISIWLKIGMLAPSLEILDALKTLGEAVDDALDVVIGVWLHLKPVLLNVWYD